MSRITGVNLPKANRQNRIAIKEILYKYGPISRADIASMMGLTLPTITTNIAELIAQGMATELSQAAVSGTVGRRAKPVDVMAAYRYVIGVEVAPYRCTLCINDLRMGHMISEEAARDNGDYDEMVRFVAGRIEALIQASGVDRAKIAGVGVGVPGFVERSTSVIRSMGRFGWKDKPMGEDLNRLIGLPVCVENNARVRVIGEDVLNGRIRPDTFAYLFVSLGIACPLMIKNSLFSGKSAGAGEIGHTIMQLDGPKCDMCGKRGCLDSLASDSAILKHCRNAMETGGAQVLKSYVDASGQLTMKEVVQAQQTGDPVVRAVVMQAIQYLAIELANVINFMSPEQVVVDAYVMRLAENRDAFMHTVREYLFGINDTQVSVEFKDFDPLSGCKGASALAIRQFFIRD